MLVFKTVLMCLFIVYSSSDGINPSVGGGDKAAFIELFPGF